MSTLRGQLADNQEWRIDPSRPAVIVGTVDMIGSRLLFQGYGCGFRSRPLHAGLLGQDVLLVHDEAHLEPAFQALVEGIRKEQLRAGDVRPLRIVTLTATPRGGSQPLSLDEADRRHPEVRKRLSAKKRLELHGVADVKKHPQEIAKLALRHKDSGAAVLVYVRTIADVRRVEDLLSKELKDRTNGRIAQLTGAMRGWERDRMANENPIFARFKPGAEPSPDNQAVYLICTSAGEVGVNISARHMVCDLSTFESMAQRCGRVNRFGLGDAEIDVVHPLEFASEKDELEERRRLTLLLLKKLDHDASPAAFDALAANVEREEIENAFAPTPVIKHATDILYDAWAMTTIMGSLPGRPAVAEYLHGVEDGKRAETQVAWRDEVQLLGEEQLALASPGDLLEDYPLKPHELLRDATVRVVAELERIVERLDAEAPGKSETLRAWVVARDGTVQWYPLMELVALDRRGEWIIDLRDCTVILPPRAGGLTFGHSAGFLNGGKAWTADVQYDISDQWSDQSGRPMRSRVRRRAEAISPPAKLGARGRLVRQLVLSMPDDEKGAEQEADDSSSPVNSVPELKESPELRASGIEAIETEVGVKESEGSSDDAAIDVSSSRENDTLDEESTTDEQDAPQLWCWFVRVNVPEGDASKHSREPIALQAHLDDVSRVAADLAEKLKLPSEIKQVLAEAGQSHDTGKNRRFWQRSIGNHDLDRVLAKSGSRGRGLEIGFSYRHEFGSLLDLQRGTGSNAGATSDIEGFRDLLLHCVAAHHGRVRLTFRRTSAKREPTRRFSKQSPRKFRGVSPGCSASMAAGG